MFRHILAVISSSATLWCFFTPPILLYCCGNKVHLSWYVTRFAKIDHIVRNKQLRYRKNGDDFLKAYTALLYYLSFTFKWNLVVSTLRTSRFKRPQFFAKLEKWETPMLLINAHSHSIVVFLFSPNFLLLAETLQSVCQNLETIMGIACHMKEGKRNSIDVYAQLNYVKTFTPAIWSIFTKQVTYEPLHSSKL